MAPGSQRTRFSDPTLIRLLAAWAPTGPASPSARGGARSPQRDFAERLSRWLHWTDTGELCAVLDAGPADAPAPWRAPPTGPASSDAAASAAWADAPTPAARALQRAEQDLSALRQRLAQAIADDCHLPHAPHGPRSATQDPTSAPSPAVFPRPTPARRLATDPPTDFATYRRRCARRQQAMEHAIGPLRARVRDALAACGPDPARLAAVDAVMERTLANPERSLLSMVPVLLQGQFDRLCTEPAHQHPTTPGAPGETHEPGLNAFCRSMHAVLLAELALRLQPVEGLLAALRSHTADPASAPLPP